ncbi:hypothetical protein KFK09_014233 [Dendrobium nobile]|uniref:Uncharacterized protein n=1 Tax=Dendrobium nobile TaxID=94219 RepID=A0A8T3BF31_DENNO|nr:hypothetical protein KFK09_014233 [Dendrobium nobile]
MSDSDHPGRKSGPDTRRWPNRPTGCSPSPATTCVALAAGEQACPIGQAVAACWPEVSPFFELKFLLFFLIVWAQKILKKIPKNPKENLKKIQNFLESSLLFENTINRALRPIEKLHLLFFSLWLSNS